MARKFRTLRRTATTINILNGSLLGTHPIQRRFRLENREALLNHLAGGLTADFPTEAPGVGTYSVVSPSNLNVNSIATNLAVNDIFPNAIPSVDIFDMTQKKHLFDRQTFPPFAKAVAEFVHNCNLYAKGEASTLPPNRVTLHGVAKPLPACSVYQTATQPILKNVPTKILFNTVESGYDRSLL